MSSSTIRFSDLLRQTTAQCNSRGKQLAVGVLAFGIVSIILWLLLLSMASKAGVKELTALLGPAPVARIAYTMKSSRDAGLTADAINRELQEKFGTLPQQEQVTIIGAAAIHWFKDVQAVLVPLGLLLIFLWLWSWAYFLVLAAGPDIPWWPMALLSLRWLPRLITLFFLVACMLFLWVLPLVALCLLLYPPLSLLVVLAGVVTMIVLGPRLVLAPVILIHDRAAIRQSIRKSIRESQGRWWKIVLYLLGVGAVVWIGVTFAQIIVNLLIRLALPFSSQAIFISQVMVLVTIVGAAYRKVFLVKLRQTIVGK